jgi:hypothetical protein
MLKHPRDATDLLDVTEFETVFNPAGPDRDLERT